MSRAAKPTPTRKARAVPAARAEAADPVAAPARTRQRRQAWVLRAWARLLSEPSLGLSVGYLLVSLIGLWANYWFYRTFDLPILEYMQVSDYLVAGLRDPKYALVLAISTAVAWLVSWPEVFRQKHPRLARRYQQRLWGKLVFPEWSVMRWTVLGVKPETGIAAVVFIGMGLTTCVYVMDKAESIREHGSGHAVRVTLADGAEPLPGQARLLGTSSSYVFLWWPRQRMAEAVPIESIARLRSVKAEPTQAATAIAKPAAGIPAPVPVPAVTPKPAPTR
ncbi:MAG: hypothetical protein ACREP7_11740 [Lysobacter sp.]